MRRPDHTISQRRRGEESRAAYAEKSASDAAFRLKADWENFTHDRIAAKSKLRDIDKWQAMHAQTLEDRRERLARLLAAEQAEYEQALDGLVETQDQRRERMAAKALELKQKRECQRQEVAQVKLDTAFRNGCDVLRDARSRTMALQVAADRGQQVEWNAAKKAQREDEDRIFDEMWEQERLKKVQRARDDLERTRAMNQQLRVNLGEQLSAYQASANRDKELKEDEDRLYKEQIQLQLEMDTRKETQKRGERVALGVRNRDFNLSMKKQKEDAVKREKEEDQRLLNELLGKIKAEEIQENDEKRQEREEARRYMEALKAQMGQDAENEADMEKLWEGEIEKSWAKREAQWAAEQEARDSLLKEVFEERRVQLELRRQQVEDERKQRSEERDKMLTEMEALALIEHQQKAEKRQSALEAKDGLVQQKAQKELQRENERREKQLEKKGAELAEMQFRERVQQQLDAVESTKPVAYRHIRHVSSRPF